VHTVTKVLVVFAAILAVLLAALTMAYSINAERITSDWRDQTAAVLAANARAADAQAMADTQTARLTKQIDDLNNQIIRMQTDISRLESERTNLLTQVAQAQSETMAIRGQVDQALAGNTTLARINQAMTEELGKLRDNELASKRREIELTDRLNDLESQREVLDQSVRSLQEQLAEANRTIQSGGVSAAESGSAAPYAPNIPISGRVVSVDKNPATGKPMATVNVGTNDRVRQNMQLVITRNGQFLGNFIVTKTDLQWSLGQIDPLGKPVDVREGDQVSSLVSR
jgi:prefoldin subunit 5